MSEKLTIEQNDTEIDHNNTEYLQHHPDAVVDPARAEYMAYASKEAEERAAKSGKEVLRHIANFESADELSEAGYRDMNEAFPTALEGVDKESYIKNDADRIREAALAASKKDIADASEARRKAESLQSDASAQYDRELAELAAAQEESNRKIFEQHDDAIRLRQMANDIRSGKS